jgi:hypothetical protein
MADLAQLDRRRNPLHRSGDVVEELPLLASRHQPEEGAGLSVIVVADAVVIAIGVTGNVQRRVLEARASIGPPKLFGS